MAPKQPTKQDATLDHLIIEEIKKQEERIRQENLNRVEINVPSEDSYEIDPRREAPKPPDKESDRGVAIIDFSLKNK